MKAQEPLNIINKIYEVREITNGVYDIDEGRLSTMYLIEGNKRALVIDCGIGIGNFKGVIDSLTKLPYDVAISHAHVDHIGGRGQFPKIYLHKDDVDIITKVTPLYRGNYKRIFLKPSLRFNRYPLIKVDREPEAIPFEDGHCFDLGGRTVKVIHSSGHTLGSVSFLIVEEAILLTADNVNPVLFLFLPHADTVENYIKTAEKILAVPDVKVYWGSHLRKPIEREDIIKTLNNVKLILNTKKNTKHSHYRIRLFNKSIFVYLSDRIHN